MKKYFYLNGKISDLSKPAIQINDIGLLRGYAVFDFMRTYQSKVFHWSDHFKRFTMSAHTLNLKIPISENDILRVINFLMKKNRVKDCSIRLILSGGSTEDGFTYKKPTFAILLEDIYSFPKKYYQEGIKLITFDYLRLLPRSKNTNYIWAVKLASLRKKKKAAEILYTSADKILEASTANFFLFKGATLITPKDNILKGITRKIVLKLAKGDFKIEEREVRLSELDSATEAFITGTNKLIMPVVMVDNNKIGDGKVGDNTKKLMTKFADYLKNF